ncbi:MAG: hypothetical protein K8W52_43380 [Deltaproteobacteria bacterium]|nr:hypothetical protein [Deltaproteobacteria bacterium]
MLGLVAARPAHAEDPVAADVVAADPGANAVLLTSTALTQPRHALIVSSHMGVTGVTYGLLERLEVSGYVVPLFLLPDPGHPGFRGGAVLAAKVAVVRHGPVRAAVEGRGAALKLDEYSKTGYAEASAIATWCATPSCGWQVTTEATFGWRHQTFEDRQPQSYLTYRVAAGARVPLAAHVALVADVARWWDETAHVRRPIAAGLRLHGQHLMVQGSLVVDPGGYNPAWLPWLAVAYRF